MSIIAYTGTNGSGKSLHATKFMLNNMFFGKRIIANYEVNPPKKYKKRGRAPLYWTNEQLTPKALLAYAAEHHKPNKESQTLIIIDECQLMFSSVYMNKNKFKEWLDFFSRLHRKKGFDFLLLTQSIRSLERPLRDLVVTETRHWKFDEFPSTSLVYYLMYVFFKLIRVKLFISITSLAGMPGKEFRGRKFFIFRKKFAKVYNSFEEFTAPDEPIKKFKKSATGYPVTNGARGPHEEPDTSADSLSDMAAHRTAELEKLAAELTSAELLSEL